MPRPPRLHATGAFYHVILRGNHREALFDGAADRRVLNDIIADVMGQLDFRIHAFCWMTNHLHALVQISDRPLGTIMQRIAVRYSRYRHKALGVCGHLFEQRHRALLVDVDAYFLTLLRYIHRNPVKAGLVKHPSDYPWSSHRAFLGAELIPWLTTNFGLSLFSNDLERARTAYGRFIQEPGGDDDVDLDQQVHPADRRILGADDFIARIPLASPKPHSAQTLQQLAESICTDNGISVELVRSPSRIRSLASIRAAICAQAIERHTATLSEVARFLHRDPSALMRLVGRRSPNRPEPNVK